MTERPLYRMTLALRTSASGDHCVGQFNLILVVWRPNRCDCDQVFIPHTDLPFHVLPSSHDSALAWKMQNMFWTFTNHSNGALMADLIRIALSVIVPPVGVFLKVGLGPQFWLNLLLTLFFYIPGLVHAVWVIAKEPGGNAVV